MKAKCSILEKLIVCTRKEWDLFFFLVRRSNEYTAMVRGVYYRDVVKETNMCKMSVYNSLRKLEKYGIIKVTRNSDLDYDVYICGNEFKNKEWTQGRYINFNKDIFFTEDFKKLKSHEKFLFLEFYRCTFKKEEAHGIHRKVKEFYKEWTQKFHVTERVLRGYLHNLKKFFSIGIKDGNYYITPKRSVFKPETFKEKSEEMWSIEHFVKSQCNRLKMKYDADELLRLAKTVHNYKNYFEANGIMVVLGKILACMEQSIQGIRTKDRKLSGGYVHNLLKVEMENATANEQPNYEIIYGKIRADLCW